MTANQSIEPTPPCSTDCRHLLEANNPAEDVLKSVNKHLERKGLLLRKGSIVDAPRLARPRTRTFAALLDIIAPTPARGLD